MPQTENTNLNGEELRNSLLNSYFYIEDISGSENTLQIVKGSHSSAPVLTVYYTTTPEDSNSWSSIQTSNSTTSIIVPSNGKMYLKCTCNCWGSKNSETYINTINCTGQYNVGGNIMSLLYGDDFKDKTSFPTTNSYTFCYLFRNSTKLINVQDLQLPATTLAQNCYSNMFSGCTSLSTAPSILPATTLASSCYSNMFQSCRSLTTAPSILPATTLAQSCYSRMFYDCTSLTTAPELPATTLASYCYYSMFQGCSSLTTAPSILPATTLASYCYQSMFQNCTSLITAPSILPATTLANSCYSNMFQNCTSLITAPSILPATTLVNSCYSSMFSGCTSLTTAPSILPATTLATGCYNGMFQNCTKLTTAPELPATTLAQSCYQSMFQNCTKLTTAPELPATTLAPYCYQNMFSGTNVLPDCSKIDFTSETVVKSGGLSSLFRGTKVTDEDLMKILPINPKTNHYYLPVMNLNNDCYSNMFYGCTNLITAPELPATTLAQNCYYYMFYGCTNLITAPELPATTLAQNCYSSMFYKCSKLTTAPELPATTLAQSCYSQMFYQCTSLTTAPSILPATTLANNCYQSMFYNCSKLTTAPELPAITLAQSCCYSMFQGCTSLTTAPELPATTLAPSCYYQMFLNCISLTIAPSILPATTLAQSCYQSMFLGCKSLTTAPELPATTLAQSCYYQMFNGCSKLNYIKADFIDYNSSQFTYWVQGVSSTGTFVMNSDATYNPDNIRGVNGIPTGWNIKQLHFKLTFENIDKDKINTLVIDNTNQNILNLQYSLDKTNWIDIDNYPFTIEYDTKIGLSGTNITVDGLQIHCTELYKVSGNITYLLNEEGDNLLPEDSINTFRYLFVNDTNLTDISGLVFPENTVPNCYQHMFTGCSKLSTIPELPAIDLTKSCYHGMFMDCDSINKVSLPEAFLAPYAYSNMFLGSHNLSDVTVTYFENIDKTNYSGWLDGVHTNGDFKYINDSEVEDNTIRNSYYIPETWTITKSE